MTDQIFCDDPKQLGELIAREAQVAVQNGDTFTTDFVCQGSTYTFDCRSKNSRFRAVTSEKGTRLFSVEHTGDGFTYVFGHEKLGPLATSVQSSAKDYAYRLGNKQ